MLGNTREQGLHGALGAGARIGWYSYAGHLADLPIERLMGNRVGFVVRCPDTTAAPPDEP